MKDRIKGILLLLPLIPALYFGKGLLYIVGQILSILAIKEFYLSLNNKNIYPSHKIAYISILGIFIFNVFDLQLSTFLISSVIMIIISILYLILSKKNMADILSTIFGIIYIALPFQWIILLYNSEKQYLVWLIILIAFSTDTFAYVFGKLFGKHKLIPIISPNKTIEGSIGGIVMTCIVVIIFCKIQNLDLNLFIPLSLIGSVLAQIGDLFASAIKRYTNVKDFGNIIPGHGGILDRFDSILLLTFFIYPISIFI